MLYGDDPDELYLPHGLVPAEDSTDGYDRFRSNSTKPGEKWKSRFRCRIISYALVIVLSVLVAFFVPVLLDDMQTAQVRARTIITSKGVEGYPGWADSSLNSLRYHRVYVFNITNPEGILKGEKVHVKECGPFIYTVVKEKINVAWDEHGKDQVSYNDWTHYTFDREKTIEETGGKHTTDHENFTVANSFFWGMEAQAGKVIWKDHFKDYTPYNRMFAHLSVIDLVNGYGTGLFKFPGLQPNQPHPSDAPAPNTQRVGETDQSLVGNYVRWHDQKELSVPCPWGELKDNCSPSKFPCCGGQSAVWQTPPKGSKIPEEENEGLPNVVTGTNGAQFPPGNHSHVAIFVDALSRHVKLNRVLGGTDHYGVKLLKYSLPAMNPANGNATTFSYNKNYYMFGPRGIQNGTMTEKGAPIFFSMPHFLGVGKEASERVNGLRADESKHETFIGVNPTLGLTFLARQRLQINVQVRRVVFNVNETWFPDIMPGKTYVPLAWIEEASESKKSVAEELRDVFSMLKTLKQGSLWLGIVAGSISFLLFAYSGHKYYSKLGRGNDGAGESLVYFGDHDAGSYGSLISGI